VASGPNGYPWARTSQYTTVRSMERGDMTSTDSHDIDPATAAAPRNAVAAETTPIKKHPGGRPTLYTDTLAKSLMEQVASSPDSIDTICANHHITPSTFWLWVKDNQKFSEMFNHARSARSHTLVHSDHAKLQELEIKAEMASNEELRRIDLQSRIHRIRIGRNQWMAERMNPRQYAPQQHVDVTQRALNVHLHADTPEDVQDMASRLEELR